MNTQEFRVSFDALWERLKVLNKEGYIKTSREIESPELKFSIEQRKNGFPSAHESPRAVSQIKANEPEPV